VLFNMLSHKVYEPQKEKIHKKYFKDALLDSANIIEFRINLINHYSKKCDTIPTIAITDKGKYYKYEQDKIKVKSKKTFLIEDFIPIAKTLTYLNNNNFIHGDLNLKNIKWTNEGFRLLDFEPSLKQLKYNRQCYMITEPYYSSIDIQQNYLSSLTDKIGFIFFMLRSLNKVTITQIVEFAKKRNFKQFIGCFEEELLELNYYGLLDTMYNRK